MADNRTSAATDVRIAAQDISFSYSETSRPVFEGISLSVREGEVISILGPNGTGKSTLLKCLAGLIRPFYGTVLLDGTAVAGLQPHEIAKKIAYVPQKQVSPFPFTVRDIVLMGRASHLGPLSSPGERDVRIADAVLKRIGIVHLAERRCDGLSGGEWQLVLIARALAQETSILLLDEPTSHLDLGNQMKVLEVIGLLRLQGITIVIATHFPDQALLNSTRVAILKDKGIMACGAPEEVITEHHMLKAYGVEVKIVSLDAPVSRKLCVPISKNGIEKTEQGVLS